MSCFMFLVISLRKGHAWKPRLPHHCLLLRGSRRTSTRKMNPGPPRRGNTSLPQSSPAQTGRPSHWGFSLKSLQLSGHHTVSIRPHCEYERGTNECNKCLDNKKCKVSCWVAQSFEIVNTIIAKIISHVWRFNLKEVSPENKDWSFKTFCWFWLFASGFTATLQKRMGDVTDTTSIYIYSLCSCFISNVSP